MQQKDVVLSVVTLVVWYFFAYYLLYVLKNPVSLPLAALVLLVLGTLGMVTCPWFVHTPAWKELMSAPPVAAPKAPPTDNH